MTKNSKEFRSNIAEQMKKKFDHRNEELSRIEKSPYSEWLREQMRKEIMDNFYAEMDEFKKMPWYEEAQKDHVDEIKSRISINDADLTVQKTVDGLQNLKDSRENWKEKIKWYIEPKEKIAEAAEKIPVKVEIDSEWSRLIEFKLWDKTYKILDPILNNHSDSKYRSRSIYWDRVFVLWMQWNDVEKWKNRKLAEYVMSKQQEWLHIPEKGEFMQLLQELWKFANLKEEADQVAMLMYLIWMDWNWNYWLGEYDDYNRGELFCTYPYHYTVSTVKDSPDSCAKIFMMSCN